MASKSDVIKKVADVNGVSISTAKQVVEDFLSIVIDTVTEEKSVNLSGFGKFSLVEKPARKARNPKTGEEVDVPAKTMIKFKSSKLLETVL